jgi:hypothetical protein
MAKTVVSVALIGDPQTAFVVGDEGITGLRFPQDFEIPYADRPKVDLEVEEDDTLGSIMLRAAQHFNVESGTWGDTEIDMVAFIAFYTPEHEREFRGWHVELPLVDEEGRLYFDYEWKNVTFAQVQLAADAGVFVGDPTKPYLLLQPGIGNGQITDWATLHAIYEALKYLVAGLSAAGGIYGGVQAVQAVINRLRERLAQAAPVIESQGAEWDLRRIRPDNLFNALGDGPWQRDDLAKRLGTTPEQAEAFILGAGWAQDGAGLWRRGQDEEAKFLDNTFDLVIHTGMTANREAVERLVLDRARHLLDTGQAPELDWDEVMRHLPDDGVGFRDPDAIPDYSVGRLRKTWWRIRYRFRGP